MNEQASGERVLMEAEFLPSAPMYNPVQASIGYAVIALLILIAAIPTFGIALLAMPIPIGLYLFTKWYYEKYYATLSCVLTDRKLTIARGVWSRTEQAIPMDKITDLQMNQSWIMRWLKLEAIRVETAGATMVSGLSGIVGIKDSRAFREAVLEQRDKVVGSADRAPESVTPAGTIASDSVLEEIRDTLVRIEEHLRNGAR